MKADTSPNRSARHRHHSVPQPPTPHPSANNYTDRSPPYHATDSMIGDKDPAAGFACTGQTTLRNRVLPATKYPAIADPRSLLQRILIGTAEDPSLHCVEPTFHFVQPRAGQHSKMFEHARHGEGR